jgi:hypothetical protein
MTLNEWPRPGTARDSWRRFDNQAELQLLGIERVTVGGEAQEAAFVGRGRRVYGQRAARSSMKTGPSRYASAKDADG